MIDLRPTKDKQDASRQQDESRRERLRSTAQRLYREFRKDFEFLEEYDRSGGRPRERSQRD